MRSPSAGVRRQQIDAAQAPLGLEAEQRGDGRQHVDETRRVVAGRAAKTGNADQQRNVDRGIGQMLAVGEPVVVLAEAFPVVRREDDDAALEDPARGERIQQAAELAIEVRHLARVAGAVEGDLAVRREDTDSWGGRRSPASPARPSARAGLRARGAPRSR